ncbi:hypothetical protein SynBIOSE41_02083 [Synechococcus sp. BIOS-E4-1]|uniref:hypothetical protein n=1 Tax=Synechococcus sp. BIOS-E4-1 TaxID=1400864 RepID=UPI0016490770|nr:hypothetical protein [Synechococcus sp. BIOS-E4-1]QNI54587.1 hypothetical protein SynBIOSE41_02083 [Synechococcus sp. BIOS-E4-1]
MPFGVRSGKIRLDDLYENPTEKRATAKEFMLMYEKLVKESWDDQELRARLIENPEEVFNERGFDTSEMKEKGYRFRMVETDLSDPETESIKIPLPNKPASTNLTEEELAVIAGGTSTNGSAGSASTLSCPACSAGSVGSAGCQCNAEGGKTSSQTITGIVTAP